MNKRIFLLFLLSIGTLLPQIKLPPLTVGYGDTIAIKHIKSNMIMNTPGTAINFLTVNQTSSLPSSAYWTISYTPDSNPFLSGALENESSFIFSRLNTGSSQISLKKYYIIPEFKDGQYSFSASSNTPTEETPSLHIHFANKTILEVNHEFYMTVSRKDKEGTEKDILVMRDKKLTTESYNPEKIPEEAKWTVTVVRPRMLTYGDIVTLQHIDTKSQLWTSTKEDQDYPNQYPAGITSDLTEQTQWRVLPPFGGGPETYMGRPLTDNSSLLVLENIKTGNLLTSHEQQRAQKATNNDFIYTESFEKDRLSSLYEWRPQHKKAPNDFGRQIRSKIPLMLINNRTKRVLTGNVENEHSHNNETFIELSGGKQDILAKINLWKIMNIHISPLIKPESVIQLRHDLSNKYLGIDDQDQSKVKLVEKNDENSRWIVFLEKSKKLWNLSLQEDDNNQNTIPNNSIVSLKHEKTGALLYISPENEDKLTVKKIDYTTLTESQKKLEMLRSELAIRFSSNPIRHQKRIRIYHDTTQRFLSFDPAQQDDITPKMSKSSSLTKSRTYDHSLWTIELAKESSFNEIIEEIKEPEEIINDLPTLETKPVREEKPTNQATLDNQQPEIKDENVISLEITSLILTIPHRVTRIQTTLDLFDKKISPEVKNFVANSLESFMRGITNKKLVNNKKLINIVIQLFNRKDVEELLKIHGSNPDFIYEKIKRTTAIFNKVNQAYQKINEGAKKFTQALTPNLQFSLTEINPVFQSTLNKLTATIEQHSDHLKEDIISLAKETLERVLKQLTISQNKNQNLFFLRSNIENNIIPLLNDSLEQINRDEKLDAALDELKTKKTISERLSYTRDRIISLSGSTIRSDKNHCAQLIYSFIMDLNAMNSTEQSMYKKLINDALSLNVFTKRDETFITKRLIPAIQ